MGEVEEMKKEEMKKEEKNLEEQHEARQVHNVP